MKKWLRQICLVLFAAFAISWVGAAETIGDRYRVGEIEDQGSITGKVVRSLVSLVPYPADSTNLSRFYLSSIFGQVSGALEGESGGLMALLFRVFNLGIFGIASMLVIYASVFSVSTSSHDGGVMGSGRFSPFSIARVIGSMAALLPTFGGYSMIQVIVMKVIVAGTVVADIAFEASLDYLNVKGGDALLEAKAAPDRAGMFLAEPLQIGVGDEDTPYRDYAIRSEVEEYPLDLNGINAVILDSLAMIKPCAAVIDGYVGSEIRYRFLQDRSLSSISDDIIEEKIKVKMQLQAEDVKKVVDCFEISLYWPKQVSPKAYQNNQKISTALRSYITACANGVLAKKQKDPTIGLYSDAKIASIFSDQLRMFSQTLRRGALNNLKVEDSDYTESLKKKGWASAGIHFDDLLNIEKKGEEDDGSFIVPTFGNRLGINLRSFEYALNDNVLKPAEISAANPDTAAVYTAFSSKILNTYLTKYVNLGSDSLQPKNLMEWLYDLMRPKRTGGDRTHVQDGVTYTRKGDAGEVIHKGIFSMLSIDAIKGVREYKMGPITVDSNVIVDEMMRMSGGVAEGVIRTLYEKDIKDGVFEGPKNPILAVQILGDKVLHHTMTYFKKSTDRLYSEVTKAQQSAYGIVVGIAVMKGMMKAWVARNKGKLDDKDSGLSDVEREALSREASRAGTMGFLTGVVTDPVMYLIEFAQAAAKAVIGVYLPLGNGMAVVYFVSGIILAAYIPFAPTLIYIFSVLAWIFGVIEAMVAAPIVMTGFAHPEGHEMLGKTEQAVMLLVGVFVRPFITLLGFLLAIGLSVTLIKAFNTMFAVGSMFFFRNALQVNHPIPLMFAVSGFVLLYSYSLMVILQQCYSMIYVIPDQILKWIGGPAESAGSGIASAMRSISTGLSQQSQAASTGGGNATRGAMGVTTGHD